MLFVGLWCDWCVCVGGRGGGEGGWGGGGGGRLPLDSCEELSFAAE